MRALRVRSWQKTRSARTYSHAGAWGQNGSSARTKAPREETDITPDVRITPVREEQLKERLGERFRELDIPLLVEWPDGRRAALVFVVEEETDPKRFSVLRLAHYCLDIAELLDTRRVVPVVVFLRGSPAERELDLGGDEQTYLRCKR